MSRKWVFLESKLNLEKKLNPENELYLRRNFLIVILKILTTNYSGSTTGSPTVTTDGSYTIVQYDGTGTYRG